VVRQRHPAQSRDNDDGGTRRVPGLRRRQFSASKVRPVSCTYTIDQGKLELNVTDAFSDIDLSVRVVVSETSPGVLKNLYPDRSAVVTAACDNIDVTWDEAYVRDRADCLRSELKDETQLKIVVGEEVPFNDHRPKFDTISPTVLIQSLAKHDPQTAFRVAQEVAKQSGVSTELVLGEAFRGDEGARFI
jgi:hypothetical protein